MKELIEKVKKIFTPSKSSQKLTKRKSKAQSMVEFAVLLPLLLILFTGMIEFGFMLNTYLSILDSTRFAARKYSNSNPYTIDSGGAKIYNENFSTNVAQAVIDNLAPPEDTQARQITMDSTRDDILVSVIGVQVTDETTNPFTIAITRHTTDPGLVDYYSLYKNGSASKFTDVNITNIMTDSNDPVNAGLLVVEIYYSYEGILKLPWVQLFASDTNPVMLYSSTIMPLVSIRPDTITP